MAYLRNARKKRKKRTTRSRSGVAEAALGRKPTRGHRRKERGYNVAKGHSRKSKHRRRSRNPISPTNPFGSKQGGPPPDVSADQWDDAWRSATSAARRMWNALQKAAGAINFDLTPEDMDRGIEQTAAVIMLAPYPSMINATAWSGTKDNKYPLASHADKTPPMAAVEVLGGHHPFAAELQAAEEEEEPTVLSSTWETQAEKLAKLIQSKRKVEQEKRAPQAKARKKAERTAKRKASGAGPTVAELRAMAKKLGLKGAYKWKRDELIAELEEWQRPEEPEDPEYEPEEEEYEPEYEEEEAYEVARRPSRAPRAPSGRAAERLGELAGARVVRRTDVRPPAAMLDEASRDVLLYRLQGKEGPTQVWAKGALTETFGKHKRTDSLKVAANYAREWRKMRKSRAAARIIAGVEGDTRTRIVAGPIEAPRKAGPPPGEEKIDWSDVKGHVGLNPRRRNNSGWTKKDEARLKAIEAEIKWLGSHEAMMLSGLLRYNIPPLQVERDELLQKKKAAQRGNPRQISVKAARALAEFRPFKRGNTEVRQPHTAGDPSVLYLHGNAIAEILLGQGLFITDAGHPTSTTKERLNALPGVHVYTFQGGKLYLNGKKWDGDWVRVDPEGNVYELGTNPRRRNPWDRVVGGALHHGPLPETQAEKRRRFQEERGLPSEFWTKDWTEEDEARLEEVERKIIAYTGPQQHGLERQALDHLFPERDELLRRKKAAKKGNPRRRKNIGEHDHPDRYRPSPYEGIWEGDPDIAALGWPEFLVPHSLVRGAGGGWDRSKSEWGVKAASGEVFDSTEGYYSHSSEKKAERFEIWIGTARRGEGHKGHRWVVEVTQRAPGGEYSDRKPLETVGAESQSQAIAAAKKLARKYLKKLKGKANPRRRKNGVRVGDRIRFPRGEEGEVTEIRDGWGYVVFEVVLMEGWFSVSSLSKLERVPPPRRHNASGGISEEEARLQLREILRGRRTSRPKESMAAAAMKRSHKEGLSLGESWATLKSEAGIPHEFNPGGKKDRPRYGPRPSTHREVSFRDFKPLAPSKRSKALQKELKLHRPSAGVGTWASQAKRAGYMAYEKAGSRAKPKRGEFAKERKAGIESARYTEYKFRYPSERDLERKEQKEREKSEKYRLRRRLEQLERGPWRERGGYQSFSKKRK